MFDFQKEVVLNSLEDVKKFENGFRVDGMIYKNEYVGPVYKTVAVKGEEAKLEINVANIEATNVMQFVLELGLDKDYRGDFTSVYSYFRKPIVVTLAPDSNAETVAKAFKKAGFVDYKLYEVEFEGDVVTLTMSDSQIIVRKAAVIDTACAKAGCTETIEEPVVLATLDSDEEAKVFTYTPNVAEFGTYNYMIHNLRLPTHANIRFASQADVEMPFKGGKYNQYSFEYTVPRRLGGLSVAGQKTESTTIHTFFVLDTLDFEKATGLTAKTVDVLKHEVDAEDASKLHEDLIADEKLTGNVVETNE